MKKLAPELSKLSTILVLSIRCTPMLKISVVSLCSSASEGGKLTFGNSQEGDQRHAVAMRSTHGVVNEPV